MNSKIQSALRDLASGAMLSLVFGIIGYMLMFGFKIFAARFLGPDKLGLVEMSTTILNIGSIIALLGIHVGVSRYIAVYEERGDFQKLNGYLKFIFRWPIITSLAVSILIFIAAPAINGFFNFDDIFIPIIRIIALAIPFKAVNEIIYQIFYAKNRVFIQNIGNNIIERVVLLAGIFLVYFFHWGIIPIIWLFFVSVFFAFIFNLVYLKTKIIFEKTHTSVTDYRGWLAFSLPLFFANTFNFALNWTDNIVIGKFMTSADVGVYAVSFSLASFLLFFQTSFVSVFVPIISRLYAKKDDDGVLLVYKKAQYWAFSIALPFAFVLIFFTKNLINFIYGKSFMGSTVPLIILAVGFLFNVYTGVNLALIKVAKQTVFLFKTKLLMTGLNVILNVILIKKYGIVGAAIATTFALSLEQSIYLIKVKTIFSISHAHMLNLKNMAIGLVLAMAVNFLVTSHNIFIFLASISAFVLIYFGLIIILNYPSRDDVQYLKSFYKF